MIRPRLPISLILVLALSSLATPASADPAPIPAAWVGIGTLSGPLSSADSRATDVNDAGQVVGWSTYEGGADDRHPFLYDVDTGEMSDLGALGEIEGGGEATGINDAGMVVGFSATDSGPFHPFLWDPATSTMKDLGALGADPDHTEARATAINDTTVVGWSLTDDGGSAPRAFLYDIATETMTDIGTMGGNVAIAEDINDAGHIAGMSNDSIGGDARGFLYEPETDTWTDVGDLEGEAQSHAYALNDAGLIVGMSGDRPFVYDVDASAMTEIGVSGSDLSPEMDVNDAGIVIGSSTTTGGMYLWDVATSTVVGGGYPPVEGDDQGAAGDAINNHNLAVGSYYTGRSTHAVLLAPSSFRDVGPSHPFFEDIEWMSSEGISTGYDDDTFRPAEDVTRQSMAAFLYRLAGSPAFTPPATPSFPDVSTSHPFFAEVEWLVSEGITTGFPDGDYRPGGAVTRQSMSAFLYRLAGEPAFTPPTTASFPDVPLTHPFFAEIEWMASEAITTGFPDGDFRPGSPVTRQAMAAFMHRYAD